MLLARDVHCSSVFQHSHSVLQLLSLSPQQKVNIFCNYLCALISCDYANCVLGDCPFRWHTAVKNSLKQQVVPSNWFKPQVTYGKRQ